MVLKGRNPSCGDEIQLELKLKDGIIEDASLQEWAVLFSDLYL